ncbi:MAG: hypothetical protein ACRCX7_11370 [Cetobacterium sp.]|uniref:hypothetical protein n=1 Tax=Cetobacterium sp. TaxID=2071632 RepID=UPI003F3F3544
MSYKFKVGDRVRIREYYDELHNNDELYSCISSAIGISNDMDSGHCIGTEGFITRISDSGYKMPDGSKINCIKISTGDFEDDANKWVWCEFFIEKVGLHFWQLDDVSVECGQTITQVTPTKSAIPPSYDRFELPF